MANNPFDREIINARERPISGDLNTAQTQLGSSLREVMLRMYQQRSTPVGDGAPRTGCIADGLMPVAASPVSSFLKLKAGVMFIDDAADAPSNIGGVTGVDDPHRYKPLLLTASGVMVTTGVQVPNLNADPRIDIIEVKVNRVSGNPTSRDILDVGTGIFAPNVVNKTLAFTIDGAPTINGVGVINYKTGTPTPGAIFPTNAPATSAGYVRIGFVAVPGGAGAPSITQQTLGDLRTILSPGNVINTTGLYAADAGPVVMSAPAGFKASIIRAGAVYRFILIGGQGGWANGNPPGINVQNATGVNPNILYQYSQAIATNGNVGVTAGFPTSATLAAAVAPILVPNGQPMAIVEMTVRSPGVVSAFDTVIYGLHGIWT